MRTCSRLSALLLFWCILCGAVFSGCASARQVAIKSDQSFATAVFALDDAEWTVYQACKPDPACETRHANLNPLVKKALADVKAVTAAIQATPTTVPSSLPDLLGDLQRLRVALSALDVVIPGLANATETADAQAVALLARLVGGK